MYNTKISAKSVQYVQKQILDKMFYIQENRDKDGEIIPLSDCGAMVGSNEYPVIKLNPVDHIEIVEGGPIFKNSIGLKIIFTVDSRIDLDFSKTYYMQFHFYDFDMSYNLFLFNAKISDEMEVQHTFPLRVMSLTILSSQPDGLPAYTIHETEHVNV